MNSVTLIGFLGADPEVRATRTGTKFVRLRLATSEKRGDETITEWHNVVAWDAFAELADVLASGDRVIVQGALRTRSWEDKDGVKRYSTEINVGGPNGALAKLPGKQLDASKRAAAKPKQAEMTLREPVVGHPDLNDDIPF